MKGALARLWEMLRMWVRRVPASNRKVQLLETGTVRGRPLDSSIQISSTHTLPGDTGCLFFKMWLRCCHILVPRESRGFLAAGLDRSQPRRVADGHIAPGAGSLTPPCLCRVREAAMTSLMDLTLLLAKDQPELIEAPV